MQGVIAMLITICRLYDSRIDANRVVIVLRKGVFDPGEVLVSAKEVDDENLCLWLCAKGERNDGCSDIPRGPPPCPWKRVNAVNHGERYDGSDSELLALLSR
jgi:hypothetical protein